MLSLFFEVASLRLLRGHRPGAQVSGTQRRALSAQAQPCHLLAELSASRERGLLSLSLSFCEFCFEDFFFWKKCSLSLERSTLFQAPCFVRSPQLAQDPTGNSRASSGWVGVARQSRAESEEFKSSALAHLAAREFCALRGGQSAGSCRHCSGAWLASFAVIRTSCMLRWCPSATCPSRPRQRAQF